MQIRGAQKKNFMNITSCTNPTPSETNTHKKYVKLERREVVLAELLSI